MKKHYLLSIVVVLVGMIGSYVFPGEVGEGFEMATLIGALTTGAGVVTTFSGRAACDQFIMIGTADTANPLSGLQVDIDGESIINITGSQNLVTAFLKLMKMVTGTSVGSVAVLATGKNGKNATYKFTNAGATTPNLFAYSQNKNGVPIYAAVKGINATDWQEFTKFSFLIITPSANVGTIDIEYQNGHREPGMTVAEVDSLLMLTDQTEAAAKLQASCTVIDNRRSLGNQISKVRVNATTAVSVCVVKLDDDDYKDLVAVNS